MAATSQTVVSTSYDIRDQNSLHVRSPPTPHTPSRPGHARGISVADSTVSRAPKMPEPWNVDYYLSRSSAGWSWFLKLEQLLFQFLCLVAFGKAELIGIWADINDPEGLKTVKEQLADHVTNTNIMSGLLLATAAVFLTTGTPRDDMLSFDNSAPYACLLFSFGMAMGSILGGCALQLVAGRCTPKFFADITTTRARLHFTLLLMGYPLFAVILACNVLGVGLLIAAIESIHVYVMVIACLLLALPWSLFLIFAWLSLAPVQHQLRQSTYSEKSMEKALNKALGKN